MQKATHLAMLWRIALSKTAGREPIPGLLVPASELVSDVWTEELVLEILEEMREKGLVEITVGEVTGECVVDMLERVEACMTESGWDLWWADLVDTVELWKKSESTRSASSSTRSASS